MLILFVAPLVAIVGLIMFVLAKDPKLARIGEILLFVGLFVGLFVALWFLTEGRWKL